MIAVETWKPRSRARSTNSRRATIGHSAPRVRAHRATSRRKISDRLGWTTLKCRTDPGGPRRVEHVGPARAVVELEDRALGERLEDADAGDAVEPAVGGARHLDADQPPRVRAHGAPRSGPRPRRVRGRSARRTRTAARRARADGSRTRPGTPPSACPRRIPDRTSTPTGSRPENGSSSTSTSGRWTSAAASWTRCWLPSESVSARSLARSATPSSSIMRAACERASPAIEPVEPREVDELIEHAHLRVQAALLRHVAEPAARLGVDWSPEPPHLARVRLQHAEGDPHRGRLAGAVRTDEPDHLARPRPENDTSSSATTSPNRRARPDELERASGLRQSATTIRWSGPPCRAPAVRAARRPPRPPRSTAPRGRSRSAAARSATSSTSARELRGADPALEQLVRHEVPPHRRPAPAVERARVERRRLARRVPERHDASRRRTRGRARPRGSRRRPTRGSGRTGSPRARGRPRPRRRRARGGPPRARGSRRRRSRAPRPRARAGPRTARRRRPRR